QPSALSWGLPLLYGLLLRDRALARALSRPRVGPGALAAHRQAAPVAHPAIAANLHQPLDVHRDLFAEVSFHAALFFDDPADLPDVIFRQVLDANVRADPRVPQDPVRSEPPDPIDVREADFHPLRPGKIDASYACHEKSPIVNPGVACAWDSDRSPAPRR